MVVLHSLDEGIVDFVELWITRRKFIDFETESDNALQRDRVVVLRFHNSGLNAFIGTDHDRGNEYITANHTLRVSIDSELLLLCDVEFHEDVLNVARR